MIIGRGDIASVLTDHPDIIWFASGISNSRCEDINESKRELSLIMKQDKSTHIVYFSSLCIYYSDNFYSWHKRWAEKLIVDHFQSYTIVRLGNISWGKNPHTLINYLKAHPEAEIQNTYRHIVSLDEFKYWMAMIKPGTRDIMNCPGRMVFVPDLAKCIREKVGDDVLLGKASGERWREKLVIATDPIIKSGYIKTEPMPVNKDDRFHWDDNPPNNIDA